MITVEQLINKLNLVQDKQKTFIELYCLDDGTRYQIENIDEPMNMNNNFYLLDLNFSEKEAVRDEP